jgi:hypothetical protein
MCITTEHFYIKERDRRTERKRCASAEGAGHRRTDRGELGAAISWLIV